MTPPARSFCSDYSGERSGASAVRIPSTNAGAGPQAGDRFGIGAPIPPSSMRDRSTIDDMSLLALFQNAHRPQRFPAPMVASLGVEHNVHGEDGSTRGAGNHVSVNTSDGPLALLTPFHAEAVELSQGRTTDFPILQLDHIAHTDFQIRQQQAVQVAILQRTIDLLSEDLPEFLEDTSNHLSARSFPGPRSDRRHRE